MHGNYQWSKLQTRLEKIHAQLMSEVQDWRTQGMQQTAMRKSHCDSAVNSCVDYLAQQHERLKVATPEGVSVGVDEANACVWVATIFGSAVCQKGRLGGAAARNPGRLARKASDLRIFIALRTPEKEARPVPAVQAPVAAHGVTVCLYQGRSS